MTNAKLTKPALRAHKLLMIRGALQRIVRAGAMMVVGTILLTGCINLQAPTEPIVIELNINITSETIVLLAEDAGNTLDENADIF